MTVARHSRSWRALGNQLGIGAEMAPGLEIRSPWDLRYESLAQLSDRLRAPREYRPAVSQIGGLITAWMEANLWTSQQVTELVRHYQPRASMFSRSELEGLLTGKPIDPSPALFKGMAAVHEAVTALRIPSGGLITGFTALEATVMASSPLTSDDQANRPSWWFAVYCNEPRCLDDLRIPSDYRRPQRLSLRLSRFLRRVMISQGKDPVDEGGRLLAQMYHSDTRGVKRLHEWILGMRELNPREFHSHAHDLVLLVHSFNAQIGGIYDLLEELRLMEDDAPPPVRYGPTFRTPRLWRGDASPY